MNDLDRTPAVTGLRAFFTMWSGQVISLVGSGLTTFAVGVWVYNETGNVTLFTLIATFAALPAVFLSPVAGVLVDRFDRKWMLVLSDLGAALASLALLLLFVRIPPPEASPETAAGERPSFWRQVVFGWEYIRQRPGLVALLGYFASINLLIPMGLVLVTPLVLSFTDAADLGLVLAVSLAAGVYPRLRELEDALPDAVPESPGAGA